MPSYDDFVRDYWAPDRDMVLAQMRPAPPAPTMQPYGGGFQQQDPNYGDPNYGGMPNYGPPQPPMPQTGPNGGYTSGMAPMGVLARSANQQLENFNRDYWAADRDSVLGWAKRFTGAGAEPFANYQQNYWAPDRDQVLSWAQRFPALTRQPRANPYGGRGY